MINDKILFHLIEHNKFLESKLSKEINVSRATAGRYISEFRKQNPGIADVSSELNLELLIKKFPDTFQSWINHVEKESLNINSAIGSYTFRKFLSNEVFLLLYRSVIENLKRHRQNKNLLTFQFSYISLSIGESKENKFVVPVALQFWRDRWHLKAIDLEHRQYRSYVLSRISDLQKISRKMDFPFPVNKKENRIYVPHPLLSEEQKEVVYQEFGMTNKELRKNTKDWETFYFEDAYVDMDGKIGPPHKLLVLKK